MSEQQPPAGSAWVSQNELLAEVRAIHTTLDVFIARSDQSMLAMAASLRDHKDAIDQNTASINELKVNGASLGEIREDQRQDRERLERLDTALDALKKWQWQSVGAGAVIMVIISALISYFSAH